MDAFTPMTHSAPIRIAVTGAAGNIAYSLLFRIAAGGLFGDRPVIFQLIDKEPARKKLEAVLMELDDCAFPLLQDYFMTDNLEKGFGDADVAILLGAKPRGVGMERKDLLQANGETFKRQARVMNDVASSDIKVLVVGNPANTNALIALSNAPDLSPQQVSCLTRLDHNRAVSLLANRLGVATNEVKKMIIWGNHSVTQFPDLLHCEVSGKKVAVDEVWFRNEFIPTVQKRGAQIIEMRGASSAASAASAVVDHLRNWIEGTADDDWVSMGILSDGSYDVPPGLFFSYPIVIHTRLQIVQGLELNEFEKTLIAATVKELQEERETISHILGKHTAL